MDIAIVGIAGRFPDAENLSYLYNNLKEGKDSVREISKKRLKDTALNEDRKYYISGYLENIDKFDYRLFHISKAEAESMCPVQRQLLEVTYEIFESSGYSIDFYNNTNTAIFVGANTSDYYEHADKFSPTLVSGNADEYIPAKIARFFNLTGNAQLINTACSSSLVAIHNACSELILGYSDYALVCGANIYTFPYSKIPYNENDKTNLNSADGKSKAFSEAANGMSFGEAVAGVLLKPLDKAIEDENIIYAVIKGTAVNNNASRSDSIIAVDSVTQSELLKRACEVAKITPVDIGYIEAHGAGTKLGDALEIEGINLAFQDYMTEKKTCPISTIKSNIGHTRMSAGICGLVRAVLSVRNKVIFPTANFSTPSNIIDFENSAVYVNTDFHEWKIEDNKKRYAAITSLGASGINCSVIITEAPLVESIEEDSEKEYLLTVSSITDDGLISNLENIKKYLQDEKSGSVRDISYTLCCGKKHYEKRFAFCTNNKSNMIEEIDKYLESKHEYVSDSLKKLIFVLNDYKNIDDNIIQKFCDMYTTFRAAWEECKIYSQDEKNSNFRVFAFQYSLYKTLEEYGITTKNLFCIGIGEIIYDVLTGKISLIDGIQSSLNYQVGHIDFLKEDLNEILIQESKDEKVAFIELGPKSEIQLILKELEKENDKVFVYDFTESLTQNDPILKIIQALYCDIYNVDWEAYGKVCHGKRIELPFYQLKKERCWLRDTPRNIGETFSLCNQDSIKVIVKEAGITELEKDLAQLWVETLEISQISIYDDFFEMGGNSLKTTKIIREVNKKYNIKLSFEDLFDFPTVHSFAEYINSMLQVEDKVMLFWKKALKVEDISMEDNFFDLGGHSLIASQVLMSVKYEFGIELNFEDLFYYPKLKSFSNYVRKRISMLDEKEYDETIEAIETAEYYNVSPAQKRMFLLNEIQGNSTNYNVSGAIELHGKIGKNKINSIFKALINRHESFRTIFAWVDGEIKQKVLDHVDFQVEYETIEKGELDQVKSSFVRPFQLDKAPLMRVKVLQIEDDYQVVLYDFHHIIIDGVSISILMTEFSQMYRDQELSSLEIQYKDYAAWLIRGINEGKFKNQEEYWLSKFQDELPILNLPTDFVPPAIQNFRGNSIHLEIDEVLTQKLYKLGGDTESTVYMILLSVFNILLSKYTGQEDIVIGSPIFGRNHLGLDKIIGMFANTLAFRNFPEGEKDYLEFLSEVKENALKGYENQDYQFDQLIEKLDLQRDFSRNPLFDVMFVLQNEGERNEFELDNLRISLLEDQSTTSKFDLLLNAVEESNKIFLTIEYNTDLFMEETVQTMLNRFITLAESIVTNPKSKLKNLSMLTFEEQNTLLNLGKGFSGTRAEKTVIGLFDEQVRKTPENIAIYYGGENYTYREINQRANQLYHAFRLNGVCRGDIVALYMQRLPEMIIGLIATLKLNCAYLAVDPNYPDERITFMLKDSHAKALLVDPAHKDIKFEFGGKVILYDENVLQEFSDSYLQYEEDAEQLLYLVYTSGTTGLPKAVMITNRNLVNLILHEYENTDIDFTSNVLQFTTMSFDVCYQEIFTTLLCGGKLCIIDDEDKIDVYSLCRFIRDNNIEVSFLPTAYFKNIVSNEEYVQCLPGNLKHIICAGEKMVLTETLHEHLKNTGLKIHNHYGPAETHVVTTYTLDHHNFSHIPPIGKPIKNNAIYIMDKYYNIQPIGVAGELFVVGDNVGKGYLNQDQLTEERFLPKPEYLNCVVAYGNKMYRTGDIARYLPDGNIEYITRMDEQVKIRGYRVEVGEVEKVILDYTGIIEVTVSVQEDKSQNKFLCAYLRADKKIEISDVKNYLKTRLPDYMVPAHFVQIVKFKLTNNGKIDKRALPSVDEVINNRQIILPCNQEESKLVEIWARVLDLKEISVVEKFFDLGGNSLKSLSLISEIKKAFNIEINIRQIFELQTIEQQATYIKGQQNKEISVFPVAAKKDYYPLTYAQKRMYILSQKKEIGTSYNMTSTIKVTGSLNLERTIECFKEIIQRHEILRTSFATVDGKVMQKIEDYVPFSIEYETVKEEVASRITMFIKEFELTKAPLFRVKLMKTNQEEHILVVDMHHIIFDGCSIKILIDEFKKLYMGETLQPVEFQYRDYSEWQISQFMGGSKQEKYWLDIYKTPTPVLDIPTDYPRATVQKYEGASYSFEISEEVTNRLRNISSEHNTTMFMNLIAIYNIFLAKLTGQEDIVVGLPIAGRNRNETQKIMGLFLNTLALRNKPEKDKSFLSFLGEVRENALRAYENEDYPFEMLLEKLTWRSNSNRTPLFDTVFNMQDVSLLNNEVSYNDAVLKFDVFDFERNRTTFDLVFFLYEYNDKMIFNCDYSTALFSKETIVYFMNEYLRLIEEISLQPMKCIGDFYAFGTNLLREKKNAVNPSNEFEEFKNEERKLNIIEVFEMQVERNGSNIAVQMEQDCLTYDELNHSANQIARSILKDFEETQFEGKNVAILFEHGIQMIEAMLGILKVGKTYVPMDNSYPIARLKYILNDSGARLIVTNERNQALAEELAYDSDIQVICLDKIDQSISKENLNFSINQDLTAFIIYTSGSSGSPKGVMHSHKGTVNFIGSYINELHFNETDRVALFTSYSHAVAIIDIFAALFRGACVLPYDLKDLEKMEKMAYWIKSEKITIYHSIPQLFRNCMRRLEENEKISSIRLVLLGGEAVFDTDIELFKKHFTNHCYLANVLGASEVLVGTIYFLNTESMDYGYTIPVGYDVEGVKVYILDKVDKEAFAYQTGEIVYKSRFLAQGYWNKEDKKKAAFTVDPIDKEGIIYRSGDLGRRISNGAIEYLGRKDYQIKIRGYRIEIGEVESCIHKLQDVQETVVIAREHENKEKYLCAYFTAGKTIHEDYFRKHLASELPSYMIPQYFIQIDAMPCTPNGKIDRNALYDIMLKKQEKEEETQSADSTESKLMELCGNLLGVENISLNDSFFDIGGHSLSAVDLTEIICDTFKVDISLRQIYELKSLKELVEFIDKLKSNE